MASMGPVIAYHVGSWDRFPSGYNFGLVGLIEPQISNVSFEYGKDASGPKFPITTAVSVPEPVTLVLLGPATIFALWRRRAARNPRANDRQAGLRPGECGSEPTRRVRRHEGLGGNG
jgi:hypothetical protein